MSDSQVTLGQPVGRPIALPVAAIARRRAGPALRRFLLSDAASWIVPVLLLLIRPLSCAVALRATGMDRAERLWVGWFGVRGVSSLFYAAAAVEAGILAAGEAETVMWTTIVVIGVSIVVHGVTGSPLTRRLERGATRTGR